MALIICTECGKEMSDKAKSCPHCGCPIKKTCSESTKKNIKISLIVISIITVISIVIISFYNIFNILQTKMIEKQNNATYNNALSLLENGKYKDGKQLLETLPTDYKDVANILDEIKWESYLFECINEWKPNLIKPSSFEFNEVAFFEIEAIEDIPNHAWFYSGFNEKEDFYIEIKDYPAIIMLSGCENESGGNAQNYQLFLYSNTQQEYWCAGYCSSLDEEDYEGTLNDDMVSQCMTMQDINSILEDCTEVGNINQSRVNVIINANSYTSIEMLE